MPHYQYLIIGGGMTADAAAHGIRETDASASLGIIGSETDPPYDRPPLTKSLWKDKSIDSIWRPVGQTKAQLHLGRTVKSIDVRRKQVVDDQQQAHTFDKLLLATGGRPRRLSFADEQVIYYRTVADYRRLREFSGKGKSFAVIGGGFIGSEIAAALAMNGNKVILLFPGEGIGARVYPRDLSLHLNEFYREKGVEVLAGHSVTSLDHHGQYRLKTSGGRDVTVDVVVAGIGIEPNTDLALAAALKVDNGIVVNESLQSSHPDIYAAGDVASFPSYALNKYVRVEHEDNANTMGLFAGRNMAGKSEPYRHLPSFYSDLFELGYEAVGELDGRLEIVPDWKTPYREGVIYYLRAGRVRGVLLWNTWGQVDAARLLIEQPGPFAPKDLKGRLGGTIAA